MTTLKVHGVRDSRPEPSDLGRALPKGAVVLKDAALVQASRAGVPQLSLEGLEPDDIVEIELQDGLKIWTRVDDIPADLGRRSQRGEVTGTIELPSELIIGPASRAWGGWAIKGLKVLGLDVAQEITGFVAAHVEGKLQPAPGLYLCSETDENGLRRMRSSLNGNGPSLLFLHGTGSSTAGSFSELWRPESGTLIKPLFKFYEDRVLAHQHKTLTESPIQNAAALAEALANVLAGGSELHIVSHSRGGLVGELLARGMRAGAAPFTPDELALFDEAGRKEDRDALEKLSRVLQESGLRVTKFVRVACPARGTTLADRRLDRYFSVLVNLASLIPGLKANPVYDALTNLLAAVLKKRTDPSELPGLEAMMPTSPLVRMLNRPDIRITADLHVLGGDLAGVGVFGRLKTLVTDLYYRDDHDLVVNTPAMFGGADRNDPIRYWIDTGDKVTHFNYFSRADTAMRLVSALTGNSERFRTLEAPPSAVTSASYVKRATLSRPVVFVIPGIMGSQLSVKEQPVWMSIVELAKGGLSRLASRTNVKATGLLSEGYAALCKHLEQTHEVVTFPYDWRQSIEESASELRKAIDKLLPIAESAKQPVRLLAHSMGGLVVRAMLTTEQGRATWRRMSLHSGARFIMLGTPNGGSHAIAAMLIGRDALVKKLALLDLTNNHAGLLGTIAEFDGVLNLLPHTGGLDLFDHGVWQRLLETDAPHTRGLFDSSVASAKSAGFRWAVPALASLTKAKKLAALVRESPLDPTRVVYVAGLADETACDLVIDEAASADRKVKVLASTRGDGRVLWETGIPKDIPAFYMDTVHGDLANDRRHFPALVDLLEAGTTSKLPTRPPARRAVEERFELRTPMPSMVPDQAEIVADALGGRRAKLDSTVATDVKVSVRVVHDNITNARHPVLLSHYWQDVIVAAEAYMNRRLYGRLSELLRMELYPGMINTAVVVLNEPPPNNLSIHPGTIVAGLGRVGELTPGPLTSTLANALTMYGAECVGRERRRQQREDDLIADGRISAPLTAILIGSGEGGVTLQDSVQALLRAVAQANQRLRPPDRVETSADDSGPLFAHIDRVDIFELYEDRAIEALHTLRTLADTQEFDNFQLEEFLVSGAEGQRRARFDQALGWWQRIRVTKNEKDELEFEAVTQAARAKASLQPTQRELVNGFVQEAIATTARNQKLGQTLFELLVPNGFKPYAPDRRKLALMLNPEAAAIPWELIHDGFDRSAQPVSVVSGMIRQLLIDSDRAQILRSPSNTALVVGNPIVSDPRFVSLPGATDEARRVNELLRTGGFETEELLEGAATPMAVLSAVHDRPWRILHLAAHGVFEFDRGDGKKPVSGLVLNDGLFFTAAEADQLRYVPELVFINCCHLGQTSGDKHRPEAFHRLAANLATQFIKIGARAVVAAGWAVDDDAAKTFATVFYQRMLNGALYGDAVLDARKAAYYRHGHTNTWGAYQCYGDPSFSLITAQSQPPEEVFVAEHELVVWLENIARKARDASRADELLRQLETREARTPVRWWDSSRLCARAGQAFAELGQFERAVYYLDRALKVEPADAPIAALEQRANCKARLAVAKREQGPEQFKAALDLLDQAEKDLEYLLEVGETPERWSLLGSVRKRRVMLATKNGRERRAALAKMKEAYAKADKCSQATGNRTTYPLGNQIAAEIALSWRGQNGRNGHRAGLRPLLDEFARLTSSLESSRTDVFTLSASGDHLLLQALANGSLDETRRKEIQGKYLSAMSRGITTRHRDSMLTHLAFLKRVIATELPEPKREPMIEQIDLLEEALRLRDAK